MEKILPLLENDGRLTPEQLAVMTGREVEDVKATINRLEEEGVILGYKALIDWDKTDREYVSAIIELKVAPQRDRGFDRIAEKIYNYPEVQSVHLMSGAYDLMLLIEGKTMKEVAYFVAYRLAPIEDVVSTATHFVLKKYKDKGVIYKAPEKDERESLM
ncbi:MAG: Lrp/AsnC family transcriptional regulator [Ruminococcaceae bacterium]|nr:Lrp/AsnC family transcriptional regulator [Oscillospiraceae bacterium]